MALLQGRHGAHEELEWRSPMQTDSQKDLQALFQQAIALHQAGRHQDSLDLCQQIISGDPAQVHAHNLSGAAAMSLGDLSLAENAFRQALAVQGDHFEARANLGRVLAHRGDLVGAEDSYRRALELRPDSLPLINALALVLKSGGQSDEALALFHQGLDIDSGDPSTLNNLAFSIKRRLPLASVSRYFWGVSWCLCLS